MMERISALMLLVFGAIVAFISLMLPPKGEIDGSVLMFFGQVLVYAGSIFGVRIYIRDLVGKSNHKNGHSKE